MIMIGIAKLAGLMQQKEMLCKSNQLSDPVDASEHQVNAHSRRNSSGNGRKMFVPIPTDARQPAPDHNSYQQRTISVRISIIFLNYLATCGCLGKLLRVRTPIITKVHSLKTMTIIKPFIPKTLPKLTNTIVLSHSR